MVCHSLSLHGLLHDKGDIVLGQQYLPLDASTYHSWFLKEELHRVMPAQEQDGVSHHVVPQSLCSPDKGQADLLYCGVPGFAVIEFLTQVIDGSLFHA